MTLLACWVGVDRGKFGYRPASIYITTDSQFSTGANSTFSFGKKTFSMLNHPDIFGYCGDVLFPTTILGQIIEQADRGILFAENASVIEKFNIIFSIIKNAIAVYPASWTARSFTILYATRDFEQRFHCYRIYWKTKIEAKFEKLALPERSGLVTVEGHKRKEAKLRFSLEYDISKNNNVGTSRTVYHWFTDTLEKNKSYKIGKIPQIVGLYRNGNAKTFGIIKGNERYLGGSKINNIENLNFVEWRNELFERCDPNKLIILDAAQRQPR
jgi:hypothetical protein